jgi:hypothetical protein
MVSIVRFSQRRGRIERLGVPGAELSGDDWTG